MRPALSSALRSLPPRRRASSACGGGVLARSSSSSSTHGYALPISRAPFDGLLVDLATSSSPPPSPAAFASALACAVNTERTAGRGSLWLALTAAQGALMAPAAALGFTFHHAEGDVATLHLWLPAARGGEGEVAGGGEGGGGGGGGGASGGGAMGASEANPTSPLLPQPRVSPVPPFATHVVGCAGVCLDDRGRLLVVQDRGRAAAGWKFPGGYAHLGEDWGAAAARETLEETGVASDFASVLALRHMHGAAWGRSDIYVMCRLRPRLPLQLRLDPREILDAAWVDAASYAASPGATPLNRFAARAALEDAAAEAQQGGAARSAAAAVVRRAAIAEEDVRSPVTGKLAKCYRSASAQSGIVD